MAAKYIAISNCRVSSDEQLQNNSLNRQKQSVEAAAKRLDAEIVRSWSGSVSSKAGSNLGRKDLLEMLDYCKNHKNVRFAIFDEYDRFMRSLSEGAYFEILFQQHGVKVWYASESETFNGDDAMAKFMRAMSGFKAEGSNEERQRKSISGQMAALKDGRYPFSPKPGYKKGTQNGIQEVDPIKGPALKRVLNRIASYMITPSQGLVELNKSDFTQQHKEIKMDKFRHMLTDPFYAGIVEIDKQVKYRNENGLHEPLISIEVHTELLDIMDKKKKNQSGPRKNGNDKFPLSNLVVCSKCADERAGRVVGLTLSNGKKPTPKQYDKYRCRTCKRYMSKEGLHNEVSKQFSKRPITNAGKNDLIEALETVWSQNEKDSKQEVIRLNIKLNQINEMIDTQVEAAIDPSNISIKQKILETIDKKQKEVDDIQETIKQLSKGRSADETEFLQFAFDFIKHIGKDFLDTDLVSRENRKRCKQVLFPAGFLVDENKKVYTPEISPLYRLLAKEKDTEVSEKSLLVRVKRL